MSNKETYTEMIDAYLTGNLNPEDSSRLMESLGKDPALKEEFLLQKDLVQSLQNKRRAELKNRLNQIEVGTGYTAPSALGLKFIAGAALVALLGTGTYFALNQADDQNENVPVITLAEEKAAPQSENTEIANETAQIKVTEVSPAPKPEEKVTETASEEKASASQTPKADEKLTAAEENHNASASEKKAVKPADETATAPASAAEVVKPDVITFFDDQDPAGKAPVAETPEDKLKNSRKFNTQNIEVSTKTDRRYPFHYRFFDNQLSIYGDFSKVPYEVLEVNTGSQASYFLYHNGVYYELNPEQRTITRLKELSNERLIKELEVTRNEKLKH